MWTTTTVITSTLVSSDSTAARRPLDLDKPAHHSSTSPARYDTHASANSRRDFSPDCSSTEPKRSRNPRQDPAAPHSRSRYPDHHSGAEGGRSRHADPYPEHLLPSRGRHGDRLLDYEPTDAGRSRAHGGEDRERDVRRKERPDRPPPPHTPKERDRDRRQDRDRDRARDLEWERHAAKEQRRDRGQEGRWGRVRGGKGEQSRERVHSMERQGDRDRQRQKDRDRRGRTRSRDRVLDEDFSEHGLIRDWSTDARAPWREEEDVDEKERRERGRHRVQSVPEDVFDELMSDERKGDTRGFSDPQQGEGRSRERVYTHPTSETGTTLSRVCVVSAAAFSLW